MKNITLSFQNILLTIFVFAISLGVGWYGQKAVENFFSNSDDKQTQFL